MPHHSRRKFLKFSGAALGGLAVGTSVTAATSTDRYIVEAKPHDDLGDVEVVHDLRAEVGYAVVRANASTLDANDLEYAPDTVIDLDLPVDDAPVPASDDTTDEPYYPLQWDKDATDVPTAHETTRGEGSRVAIIDTGVAADHPDLEHAVNEDLSRNFTGDGYGAGGPYGGYHGTHVAGIVAANDRNDAGVVGTAPGAEIIDCRVFSPSALASFADVFAAMVYSANIGCDAANLSLGAYPMPRRGLGKFYGKFMNRITAYCRRQGTLLVVAAGNDAADLQHDGHVCMDFDGDGDVECRSVISLPNEAANVMSISATGPIGYLWGEEGLEEDFDSPAFYTNYGTNAIDVSAPGGDADLGAIGSGAAWYYDLVFNTIAVPEYDDEGNYLGASYGYAWLAGTSMAAPQVSGVAALVASEHPDYNANRVKSAITGGATDMKDNAYHGRGFVSAAGALER